MNGRNRREFLADVGRGMLVASVGSATAVDLGLSPAWADDAGQRVTFGKLEPLVSVMQETAPDNLLPVLTEKLQGGASLKTLIIGRSDWPMSAPLRDRTIRDFIRSCR